MKTSTLTSVLGALMMLGSAHGRATEDGDLAQELTNPIADLITVPIQVNIDRDVGPVDDGTRITTNVQPVIPFQINDRWNLITRTIVPLVDQEDLFPGAGSQFGLGDVNASLFFSPANPDDQGLTWGVGPVLVLPTSTNSKIGSEKWAAGPGAVALSIRGPWTVGLLANHVWSFAGDDDRQDIRNTFAQPFVSYTWPSAWTVSAQSETTYDWEAEEWGVPVNLAVSKLVQLGGLPVSLQAGAGYWLEPRENGPEGWRFRLQANLVLAR